MAVSPGASIGHVANIYIYIIAGSVVVAEI